MTGWVTPLRAGLAVSFDGEQFTIAEIEGSRVMLRRSGAAGAPSWRQVDLVALLSHPGTRILAAAHRSRRQRWQRHSAAWARMRMRS
ncbi:MAG TPA: hypothetical protein VMV17_22385 [Streptosporangiaceae bacterium]|nr:hypothetical protein [Streptosporangiaceae bacterium]